jgi:hypothetical protein
MNTELSIQQYEQLNPFIEVSVNERQMIFNTPNSHTAWRVNSLFEKEPDTIAWLESFEDSAVLYDIGANVGMYSIYAAMLRWCAGQRSLPSSPNHKTLPC